MLPKWVVLAAAVSLVSASGCSQKSEPRVEDAPAPNPNVLVVTVDTLRADHLGCYGYGPARTPHIDRMAAEGVRVDRATAPTPVTLPSHTSIFTGLEPPAHGVRDNGTFRVPDAAETFAERLREEGYQTQAFVSSDILHRRFNLDQGFDGYDDDLRGGTESGTVVLHRSGDQTMDRVLQWLAKREASSSPPPFFLWVHLFDPHSPYNPLPEDAKHAPTPYDGEIAGVDRQMGRLLQKLERSGVLDETIVVFTSDHGESLGEHQEPTHGMFIYESTQHVPLIVRYPRKLPAGKRYSGPARSVDIMPTVLRLAGRQPNRMQGIDLSAALAGRAPPPPLVQYSETFHTSLMFGMAPLQGVRVGEWTYIVAPRPELYDRRTDPRELRNLLNEDGTANSKAIELDATLTKVIEESERFALPTEAKPLDDQTVAMLQALGYMGDSDVPDDLGGMDPKDGVRIFQEVSRAIQLTNAGHCADASELLRPVVKRLPRYVQARNALAVCALQMGDTKTAEEYYLESLAQKPRQPDVLLQLGRMNFSQRRYDKARRYYKRLLEQLPESAEAMLQMGYIDFMEGKFDGASRWYDRAIATEPQRVAAYHLQGQLSMRKGAVDEARGWYEKALVVAPDDYSASLQAGQCALRLGDLGGAEQHLGRASELAPTQWQPLYSLACVESQRGNAEAALRQLEDAVAKGFRDAPTMRKDPCLQSLVAQPRFQSLLRALQSG